MVDLRFVVVELLLVKCFWWWKICCMVLWKFGFKNEYMIGLISDFRVIVNKEMILRLFGIRLGCLILYMIVMYCIGS